MTFLAFIRLLSYCGISSVAQIAAPRVCAHIRQMHLCCKFYMSQVPIHLLDNGSIHFSRIPRRLYNGTAATEVGLAVYNRILGLS